MRDSNVANAAKESAQDEFPHGLLDFAAATTARGRGGPVRHAVAGRPLLAHSGRRPKSASAGSARLFGISKRGYLRTLLIHGARSALGRVRDKQDPRSLWLGKMRQRRHPNIVAVRLANKNARIVWSLLTSDSVYDVRLSVRAA